MTEKVQPSGKTTILEVAYTAPPEVFISRHLKLLEISPFQVRLVGKDKNLVSASLEDEKQGDWLYIPAFKGLSVFEKLKYAGLALLGWDVFLKEKSYKKAVVVGFFRKHLDSGILHFHFLPLLVQLLWILPWLKNTKVTVSLRGSEIGVEPLLSKENHDRIMIALKAVDGIHAVSENLVNRNKIFNINTDNLKVIHTPLIFQGGLTIKPRTKLKKFILAGRFHWIKGIIDALYFIKKAVEINKNIHLTIIGDGREKERILSHIKHWGLTEHVSLTGKLPPAKLKEYYRESDAYLQSSFHEGFSNSLAEAMYFGCIPFVTNVGGTTDIVSEKNGILLEPGKPEEWVSHLTKDYDLANFSRLAHETAMSFFNREIHREKFIAFFNEVIKEKPKSVSIDSNIYLPFSPEKGIIIESKQGKNAWKAYPDLLIKILGTNKGAETAIYIPEEMYSEEIRLAALNAGCFDSVIPYGELPGMKPDLHISLEEGKWEVFPQTEAGQSITKKAFAETILNDYPLDIQIKSGRLT